jgi:hypothetical protein
MDRAHLLPKSRLKREVGDSPEFVWHPDVWVWGCRRHHSAFDAKQLRVQRRHLPKGVERFAEALGWGGRWTRTTGRSRTRISLCVHGRTLRVTHPPPRPAQTPQGGHPEHAPVRVVGGQRDGGDAGDRRHLERVA